MINVEQVKQKILSILNQKGPSLPVPIARETELSSVFASAILSELASEKKVKLSSMKIGSSPLYLIPGQEEKLEQHADNLTGFEKSAYLKLKETKILEDRKQEPAIRVALRSIKDFAIPLRFQEKIFWRYAFISNDEVEKLLFKSLRKIKEKPALIIRGSSKESQTSAPIATHQRQIEPIFTKQEQTEKPKQKAKTNFLDKIRQFLNLKNIQLLDIEKIEKKEITAKIRINDKQYLLIAYDKKRITEKELIKAYKKADSLGLPYYVLMNGEPTKKIQETTNVYKSLLKVDSIQQ